MKIKYLFTILTFIFCLPTNTYTQQLTLGIKSIPHLKTPIWNRVSKSSTNNEVGLDINFSFKKNTKFSFNTGLLLKTSTVRDSGYYFDPSPEIERVIFTNFTYRQRYIVVPLHYVFSTKNLYFKAGINGNILAVSRYYHDDRLISKERTGTPFMLEYHFGCGYYKIYKQFRLALGTSIDKYHNGPMLEYGLEISLSYIILQ